LRSSTHAGAAASTARSVARVVCGGVGVREGQMDVRVLYEPGVRGAALLASVAQAVDAELAKTGERLVLLLSERVTGVGEGATDPSRTYKGVKYVAGPRDPETDSAGQAP